MTRHGIVTGLGVLLFYVSAVVWLTWPLGAHLSTHAPGSAPWALFDFLHNVWVLDWETRVLTTYPARLADAPIYHPTPNALFYGPTAFGVLPLFAPARIVTGSALAAMNLTLLASIVLTVWSVHFVVVRWTGSHAIAAVSGAAVLAAPAIWGMVSAPHSAMLAPLPWIIALVAAGAPSGRAVVALAALVAVQASVDPVHYMLALGMPLALVVAGDLCRSTSRARGVRVGLAFVAGLVLLSPIYAGYAAVAAANPGIEEQTVWRGHIDQSSTALQSWVTTFEALRTIPLGQLLGWRWRTWLGIGIVAIGAGCVRRASPNTKRLWAVVGTWIGVGVCGYVLSLPPIKIAVIDWFPPIRSIYRIYAAAAVGIPLLLGLATAAIVERFVHRRYVQPLVVAGLIAVLFGPALLGQRSPYPTVAVAAPSGPVLVALRRDTAPLLELPAEGLSPLTAAMYRATFHARPLITGYSSYWPAGYLERVALAKRLPDRDALEALRRATGLDMVLVQLQSVPKPVREVWENLPAVRTTGLELVARSNTELVSPVREAARALR